MVHADSYLNHNLPIAAVVALPKMQKYSLSSKAFMVARLYIPPSN